MCLYSPVPLDTDHIDTTHMSHTYSIRWMKRCTLILLAILLLLPIPARAMPIYHVYASMVTVSTRASVAGTVYYLDQPVTGVAVTLAQIYCGESICLWVLAIPGSPSARTNNEGVFEIRLEIAQINRDNPNVVPGAYVIVAGNIQDSGGDIYCQDDACEIVTNNDDNSVRILHLLPGENHIRLDVHKDLPVYIAPREFKRLMAIIY